MPRLYTRNQGGVVRFYADLRDIGGGQCALKPPGSRRSTTDEAEALKLLALKIEEVRGRPSFDPAQLGSFAQRYVEDNPGSVTDQWLKDTRVRLNHAKDFFGINRELDTVHPKDVREWLTKKLSHLAGGTQRHYLHALSGLYRYAQELGVVPLGFNPVSGLYRKPKARTDRQRAEDFFEIDEAARFLDAAVRLDIHSELIGTFLLTGGRRKEVLGLRVADIDFHNKLVRIQPNVHRGLKRVWSERVVPLWPQLEGMLRPYVEREGLRSNELLFPSRLGQMIRDMRKPLGRISADLGIDPPRLTKFRHTYATARLQTTDNGKQIALWTVAKELGHKNVARVEDTYGHPSHYRQRGEVVEYLNTRPG